MLRYIPRSGMDSLLHIFNLSCAFPSSQGLFLPSERLLPLFSSIKWKSLSTLLLPPANPLTSCVSKLFERIILSRLLFFLESNSILYPHQASFRPGLSTMDQILFLSQFISDELNKARPGSRTILATIDFSKAFDSV